jgi:hypothetical protein
VVIPFEHARLAHEAMPGSRLETMPDAGHFPHHSDPERFLAILREFLGTTSPAAHDASAWRALLRQGRTAKLVAEARVVASLATESGT